MKNLLSNIQINVIVWLMNSRKPKTQQPISWLNQTPRIKSTAYGSNVVEYFGGATIKQIKEGKTLVRP